MQCETHNFYCINCGRMGIPIMRKRSHLHKSLHRKKLYCPWCKVDINHVECNTIAEVEKFKADFMNGVFKNEAEESLSFVRGTGLRQVYVGG